MFELINLQLNIYGGHLQQSELKKLISADHSLFKRLWFLQGALLLWPGAKLS